MVLLIVSMRLFRPYCSPFSLAAAAGSGSNQLVPNHSMPLPCDPVVAASSAASSVKNLCFEKDEKEDSCALVLPNHLQALAVDCSHLKFGTYKSGASPVPTEQIDSDQLNDDCEGDSRAMYGLSSGHPDTWYDAFSSSDKV